MGKKKKGVQGRACKAGRARQGTSGDRQLELGAFQHIAQGHWSVDVQEGTCG